MQHAPVCATALSLVLAVGVVWANHDEKGESKTELALKQRSMAPGDAEMDSSVTLQALLDKSGKEAWSEKKGARIEGYVVQVEHEADNDVKLVLAAAKGEPNTQHWVVVETCPAWRKKDATLSEANLRAMIGKKVAVTGWLYREPDEEESEPRGTAWEIHPVTSIKAL